MNWRAIRAIARKDLKVVLQNKGVSVPMIVIPLLFMVLMPAMVAFVPTLETALESLPGESMSEMSTYIEQMPAGLQSQLAGLNEAQTMVTFLLVYMLAPMYLILPLMVSSVIAADSFAGEKERKSLEALLYTPTTDLELLLAKMLGAWLPALVIAWVGFLIYSLVTNLAAWSTMGRIFFPNLMWVILALWVAPAVAGLGLGTTVLISARAQTFQEAYQMGGMVVLPILLLVIGQASGVMYLSTWLVVALGFVLWAIDATLLWFGARRFRRNELAARL
jgi:ABC-2 type transport system permease protein